MAATSRARKRSQKIKSQGHTDVKIAYGAVFSPVHRNVAPGAGAKSAVYDCYDLFHLCRMYTFCRLLTPSFALNLDVERLSL